ncbi:hypothetical protein ANCCEY_06201 [Ancylostoma ceylanicum]|uniref:Uncharacterized protein n=1 Tax=Ancylostoma ceylanicum TaxID=53326 RepID=A0A0D6LU40_9BILA|nr:hypothetical protein ANCCEY_06201 [Ancylostoma ceylanicum]
MVTVEIVTAEKADLAKSSGQMGGKRETDKDVSGQHEPPETKHFGFGVIDEMILHDCDVLQLRRRLFIRSPGPAHFPRLSKLGISDHNLRLILNDLRRKECSSSAPTGPIKRLQREATIKVSKMSIQLTERVELLDSSVTIGKIDVQRGKENEKSKNGLTAVTVGAKDLTELTQPIRNPDRAPIQIVKKPKLAKHLKQTLLKLSEAPKANS